MQRSQSPVILAALTSAVGMATLQYPGYEVGLAVTVVPEAHRANGPLGGRGIVQRHRH